MRWHATGRLAVSLACGGFVAAAFATRANGAVLFAAWLAVVVGAVTTAGRAAPWRALAVTPGAVALAAFTDAPVSLAAGAVAVAVCGVSAATGPWLDRRWAGSPVVPALALAALGGIYACVPETGHSGPLAVAGAVLLVATALGVRPPPGTPAALVAALAWAVLHGGAYRPSAVVGGVASLGLLLVAPLAERLPGPHRGIAPPLGDGLVVGVQAVVALGVARTAGLAGNLGAALALAVPWWIALCVAGRLVLGPRHDGP